MSDRYIDIDMSDIYSFAAAQKETGVFILASEAEDPEDPWFIFIFKKEFVLLYSTTEGDEDCPLHVLKPFEWKKELFKKYNKAINIRFENQ